MDRINSTLRTPVTPLVTPRVPDRREERKRHEESEREPEEREENEEPNLDVPSSDGPSEDEGKGGHIDIQI